VPRTPDRRPGSLEEEAILFETSDTTAPSTEGEFRYVQGVGFQYFEGGALKTLSTSGSGLTEAAHKSVRQLIHFIEEGPAEGFASGAYKEVSGSPFPTSVVWWTSSAKTAKIVEKTITRNANKTPSSIEWKVYATDGTTVLATVTDAITYASGIFESTRTRTIA
jgi:hypothetical protein